MKIRENSRKFAKIRENLKIIYLTMLEMMASAKMMNLLLKNFRDFVLDFQLRFPFVRLESVLARPVDQTRGLYP